MEQTFSSPDSANLVRVMAVDSTPMNSQLLAEALSKHKSLSVLQGALDPSRIVTAVAKDNPHVLLLSSNLAADDEAGFKVAEAIRTYVPQTKIVILLDDSERGLVLKAFRCGVRGVFSRSGSVESLAKCIQSVQQGQIWANSYELGLLVEAFSSTAPGSKLHTTAMPKLTKRESDVVRCVVEGMSNREIAARLKLTEHTVKNYLFRIFDKVGVSSRVELVLRALNAEQFTAKTAARPVLEMVPGLSSGFKRTVSGDLARREAYRARG
jgi:DNA-binding NarL/FixJ family response regulator